MKKGRLSITSVCLAFAFAACGSDSESGGSDTGVGTGGILSGKGGALGSGGATGTPLDSGIDSPIGTGGTPMDGAVDGSGGTPGTDGGSTDGGGIDVPTVPKPQVATSSSGAWAVGTYTEATTGTVEVTVDDTAMAQTWEGFGGSFNEIGWNLLTTKDLQDEAIGLLFGTDGAHFTMGRIPMGASDYAMDRYTYDDTGTDVTPDATESNRPPADLTLSLFSIERDKQKLIPFIKAAMAINPKLRFWGSPWTPPVWMKTGYKKDDGSGQTGATAKKPSYFDGGNMKNDPAILTAHAQYFVKWIQAYAQQGISIDTVAPQNEPNFDQNYPSCLWDPTTYTTFVGQYLGPAFTGANLSTKIMLGTMSNSGADKDPLIVTTVMADPLAKPYITSIGVQWGMMTDKVVGYKSSYSGVSIWVSEHKCGNYPWNPSGYPKYVTVAPNDQAYAVESWGYIRNAIKDGVSAYSAWNMVLDAGGLGNDTSRHWAQNSLLVVNEGKIIKTPVYYVFRHFSQFVDPGAKVVATTGGDAVAFKNPDNSIVVVMYNKDAAKTSIVSVGGKKLSVAMPANGWATINYQP